MSKLKTNAIENVAGTETHNVDTMGIISGSNANGNYVKYPDGTLIQYGTLPDIASQAVGGFSATVTFPIPFIDNIYSANASYQPSVQSDAWFKYIFNFTTTICYFQFINATVVQGFTSGRWKAIGRWK